MGKTMDELMAEIREKARERMHGTEPETGAAGNTSAPSAAYGKGQTILETYRVDSDPICGGMGAVWRVHHRSWNRDLAMKRPQARFFNSGKSRESFIRECREWINLGLHPNIVSCYYVREIGGVPTVFAEWMDNGSLKNHIKNGTLYFGSVSGQQERLLDIAIQFARGLRYAHERGLIHQDVKPDNLLLTESWDAKVADFGLARARTFMTAPAESSAACGITDPEATTVTPVGGYTLAYASPEQLNSQSLTRRTDIYSWAVSVMEMYLGERLWMSGNAAGEACRGYFGRCRVPMPERLQELLAACLTRAPDGRPHDFAVVETELLQIYRESVGRAYPRRAARAAADTAESLNNRALSYLDLGNTEEAGRFFDAAAAADPRNLPSVYNRALFLWRSGKITDAEAVSAVNAVVSGGDEAGRQCLTALRAESGVSGESEYYHPSEYRMDTLHASLENAVGWHQDSGSLVLFSPQGSRSFHPDSRIMFGLRREELGFDGNNCNLALSLTDEKKITIMSLRSGSTLVSFSPFRTDVIVAAVALCRTKLAYAMADGEIFLCDIFGRPYCRRRYSDVPGRVSCLAFSGDSGILAVGYSALVSSYNAQQSVHVIDTADGTLLCTLPLGDACRELRVRDGAVTVWTGRSWSRWSIPGGKRLQSFEPETAKTGASCLSQDGRYILIARDASVTEIWDSEELRCIRTIKLPALPAEPGRLTIGEIRAVAFPEGRILISGDNGVFAYDVSEARTAADWMLCVISDYGKTSQAEAAFEALLDRARETARSDRKGALRLIEEARRVSGFENHPRALDLKAEIYASGRRGVCTIRSVFQRAVVSGAVTAMALDEAGRFCAVIRSGTVCLLALPDFREIERIAFNAPTELAVSGDGRYLLLSSEDTGRIAVYDTQKKDFAWSAEPDLSEICTVACNADGTLGLLQYDMCRLMVFELASGRILYDRREPALAFNKVCFTPDGKHIAAPSNGEGGKEISLADIFSTLDGMTGSAPGGVKSVEFNDIDIYRAEDFVLTERISGVAKGGMTGEAFPKAAGLVFTASWDRHIYLADRRSPRRESLQWHDYVPSSVCAMPDGSHVISGDQEGIICMYRVLPEPDFGFTLHTEVPADRIQISGNARYMAVMSYGRQAALYELDLDYALIDLSGILARIEKGARQGGTA